MQRIIRLVTPLIIIVFFLDCRSKIKNTITKTFYPSGELESKSGIIGSGILFDTIFYYFKNGSDSLVAVRNDSGVLNGEFIFYYDNGSIEEKGTYLDGKKNGICLRYYKGENLKSINYYLFGQMAGDVFGLTNTGRIEYYTFYDFQERARTYTSWDSTGLIKTNIGKIIFVDSLVIDPEENLFKFLLLISNPPMTRTEVTINYLNKENEILKLDTLVGERFFSTGGKLDGKVGKIKVYGIQYDSSGHAVYKDSSYKILNR